MKQIRISQNIVPLSTFKNQASKLLSDIRQSHQPLVITQNGKAAGVLLSPAEFDRFTEKIRFMEAVERGLQDVQSGRILPDDELETLDIP